MIVLMRHARTTGGRGRCIGRTPLPLSAAGVAQAQGLVQSLGPIDFKALYSSPSTRALETLAPLASYLDFDVTVVPALDEIDMGQWEGRAFETICEDDPVGYERRGRQFATFRPPDGECFNDVADRALAALAAFPVGPAPVLALTHAGVIRSILCRLTNHPMDDLFHFTPQHTWCCVLGQTDAGLQVLAEDLPPDRVHTLLD